eukprot:11440236-Ditylum_brightwellii.AAC.1
MKKQVKRLRTSQRLLNALRLLPNTYFPRRHTKVRKITSGTSFLVPDGVTTTKISREEFINVMEDRILYQWKLKFKKE